MRGTFLKSACFLWKSALTVALFCSVVAQATAAACTAPDGGLGVTRTLEIDATSGPLFGSVTHQVREPSFLKPKEVVLTFDDGPMPWVTKSILDTLDRYCTKATFFSVGRMALAYPSTVKDILARGHTLGSHTMTHPFNMPQMKIDAATDEIEKGFAAVSTAAGVPIAPFFRFTGLADSARLLAYMQARNMASFTVDVVSNDSYIHDPKALADRTLKEVTRHRGGIILFHDIKTTTAKALPDILERLKEGGFSVVHLTATPGAEPMPSIMTALAPKLATVGQEKAPVAFYGTVGPEKVAIKHGGGVMTVSSPLRDRSSPIVQTNADNKSMKLPKVTLASRKPQPVKSETASVPAADALKPSQVELTGPPIIVEDDVADATTPAAATDWVTDVRPGAPTKLTKPAPK